MLHIPRYIATIIIIAAPPMVDPQERKDARKKTKTKKHFMDQIDRLDQIDPSCKFTPEDITVWQGNRTDGQWTTVTQLSRVGMVKLRAIKSGARAVEVLGAVARLENGDHCHIAHEYIKRTIDNCIMVKQSSSAKGTLAKQLTGIIAGYVLVEWAWDEREEWILPSQIEPIGSAKKRKSNPPNRFISGGSPNVQSMQLTYLKKKTRQAIWSSM